jgi:hypothetical protein
MKRKPLFVGIVLAVLIIACSKKTVATKETAAVSTAPGSGSNVRPETTPSESLNGNEETVAADANLTAAGKTVYETKCIRCHSMKPLAAYTEPRWDAILKIMAPKANLTQGETQQVTAYVKANAKKY